ncbi:MAG: type 4b pilus protein PilO2 [Alphaproteobacteria bacterium]|nr:type 4b pilus protein PilO2 [Alphaproteobacteria bacterium]
MARGDKGAKVINVGGVKYAVGLFWQPVQDEINYKAEIKAASQNLIVGADLYAYRRGISSQYGLGFIGDGQKPGMPAGAAAVATALKDKASAVCVFQVDKGWWYVVIRNNLILAEDDIVYAKEEDAKEAFTSMLSIPDWGFKIAPASWGIEDTKEIAAAELLQRGTSITMQRIGTNPLVQLGIIGAVLAGGAYFYYDKTAQEKARKVAAESAARAAAQRAARTVAAPVVELKPPVAPWETIVDPEEFAKKCTILIVNATNPLPGWRMNDATCVEGRFTANFRRTYGSATWLFEAQKEGLISEHFNLVAQDKMYNLVVGTIQIPVMGRINSAPTPGMEKIPLQKQLVDRFQSMKIPSFNIKDETITLNREGRVAAATRQPGAANETFTYRITGLTFTDIAYRTPLEWTRILGDFNSLEFTSIKWDNGRRVWSYEVRIFEYDEDLMKKIAPPPPETGAAAAGSEKKE